MFGFRKWLTAFAALALVPATAIGATSGREFSLVQPPQSTETGNRIEVLEFFWYGCPHCYTLEPGLNQWVKKLPADVAFRRVPAIPTSRWAAGARMYYTIEALGQLDRLHGAFFDAIHKDHLRNMDDKTLADWAARQGVDRTKFNDAWNSFSVQARVKRAAQVTEAYKLDAVPAVVVDGKYLTSLSMAGGEAQMFAVLDELVARARNERGGSAARAQPKR